MPTPQRGDMVLLGKSLMNAYDRMNSFEEHRWLYRRGCCMFGWWRVIISNCGKSSVR
jgi:hypothetical protein